MWAWGGIACNKVLGYKTNTGEDKNVSYNADCSHSILSFNYVSIARQSYRNVQWVKGKQ